MILLRVHNLEEDVVIGNSENKPAEQQPQTGADTQHGETEKSALAEPVLVPLHR